MDETPLTDRLLPKEYTYEEAIKLAGFLNYIIQSKKFNLLKLAHIFYKGNGKFQLHLLIVVGISTMVIIVENLAMSYVVPAAIFDMHFTTGQQGFTYVSANIGMAFSSIFWGILGDTWGRHKVLHTINY